ncbi:MAG TPA: pyruvate kinase [Stellaceae bacterium]|jgi:pyruvate kinase|nr:pyruvate kinase [Stellaceae bacterium]
MRRRSAKIVATLGPSSSTPEQIRALFEAGVDVFRLNFSHGTHQEHLARFEAIRRVEHASGRPIAILADLQGPKLRLGTFETGRIELAAGARLRLDLDPRPGDQARAPLPHPEIFAALQPGTDLLLDDGKVRLETESCGPGFAETLCRVGGPLSDRKGVNVPNAVLPLSAITEKDRADLAFALDHGADWIAFSFVQRPDDVAEGRKLVAGRAGVMVKLEKPAAIERLAEIIELADGLMVARGDLGVEMPPEDVPSVQKQVVHACRLAGKPVIVATQMLESMIASPTPTRAEASDVATAVYEGADAVMLSAETAAGRYPIESVAMMNRIACRVQRDPLYFPMLESTRIEHEHTAPDAISAAACQVAGTVGAAAIVSYTTSGATALRAARERPGVPILVLTSNLGTARRLAVLWGAHCVHTSDVKSFADMVQKAVRIAHREEIAQAGQRVVVTAGVPFGTPGATNVLRIAWVER